MSQAATEMTLNDRINEIRAILETSFLFRKLGLCFDYASDPQQFPRDTLPNAREARECKPSANGCGTGAAQCARNGALLFDGYLLRLELGFAHPDEERVFDRLIGGLIRIGTVASKGLIARGLTPDGRGYYPAPDLNSHLFWSFSAWRAQRTPAIAKDSQDKIENIVGRWIGRLRRDDWTIRPADGKSGEPIPLLTDSPGTGLVLLALLAIASDITGHGEWRELYTERVSENGNRRLATPLENLQPLDLLPLQIALTVLSSFDDDDARKALIQARRKELVESAASCLSAIHELKPAIIEETPDLDWRSLSQDELPALGGTQEDPAYGLPLAWRRLQHEADTVRTSVEAGLVMLMSGEREWIEPHKQALQDILESTPWENLWLASSLAPVISFHARGVELGLWEEDLLNGIDAVPAGSILDVKAFLDPSYDDAHPKAAGHIESARKKPEPETEQSSKKDDTSGKPKKGRGGRRRRRRKRR